MPADKYILPRNEDKAETELNLVSVFVRDLVLEAAIGAYELEKGREQRVRINIQLEVSTRPDGIGDHLDNVVCYDSVVDGVKQILQGGHINLVETLADRIADLCLGDKQVRRAQVQVEKLDAIAEAESVGVEITKINKH